MLYFSVKHKIANINSYLQLRSYFLKWKKSEWNKSNVRDTCITELENRHYILGNTQGRSQWLKSLPLKCDDWSSDTLHTWRCWVGMLAHLYLHADYAEQRDHQSNLLIKLVLSALGVWLRDLLQWIEYSSKGRRFLACTSDVCMCPCLPVYHGPNLINYDYTPTF